MNRYSLSIALLLVLAAVAVAQPTFTDITNSAGVANSSGNQFRLSTSATWGDYDNDGDMDLYVTNWGQALSPTVSINRLYRNDGNGSFTDVAATSGVADSRNSIAAVWGDFDNDGDLDLYVVNFDDQDQLYRNDGVGSFIRITASTGVNVISQGSETAAAWGDYDGDGDLDLYLCKYYFRNSLYRNNGNGTFAELASSAGVADVRDSEHAAWCDYDGDGDLDLYVVNREQNNALYRNNGAGSFEEVACTLSLDNTDVGRNARWVDYDNDGDFDLFLANIGANALYRNDGNDQFQNVSTGDMKTTTGSWISCEGAWGDFDADGRIDVVVANGAESKTGQTTVFLSNQGGDTFLDQTSQAGLRATPGVGTAAESADFDGDGDLDLYVVETSLQVPPNILYRNDISGTTTVKIKVRRKNAADGIGASVRLRLAGQIVGHAQIGSDGDPQEVLFGASNGASYTVEVTFSDGSTASRSDVSSGSTIQIDQP